MSLTLGKYIDDILKQVSALRSEVAEVQRENRELKDILTHARFHWWKTRHEIKSLDEQIDDLIHDSNQPYDLKY